MVLAGLESSVATGFSKLEEDVDAIDKLTHEGAAGRTGEHATPIIELQGWANGAYWKA